MITTIHQPQYMPWLGYFDKIDSSDLFVILDAVQYKKNEWQNRNRIKNDDGWQWVTVPVKYKFPEKINEVKVNNCVPWGRKHLQSFVTNYAKAPYFSKYIDVFKEIFSKDWEYLVDINIYMIKYLVNILGIKTEILTASDFDLAEEPTERLIDICKQVKADKYMSGKDGVNYLNRDRFLNEGIEIIFQDFEHPVYKQLYGEFVPYLSIVDLLFNYGPDSLGVIREKRRLVKK